MIQGLARRLRPYAQCLGVFHCGPDRADADTTIKWADRQAASGGTIESFAIVQVITEYIVCLIRQRC